MRHEVNNVKISRAIAGYVTDITRKTRSAGEIILGASPRATVALIKASQAIAYIAGRDYIIPDDVKRIAADVLTHRMICLLYTSCALVMVWQKTYDESSERKRELEMHNTYGKIYSGLIDSVRSNQHAFSNHLTDVYKRQMQVLKAEYFQTKFRVLT